MSKKHILMVARSMPLHHLGGMELLAWDLARNFVKEGYRVTYLTTMLPDRAECFVEDGVNVVAIPDTTSGKYSKAWWKKSRQYFAERFKSDVSLVFSVSAGAYGLVDAARARAIPVFMQAHGTSWGEFKSKWMSGNLKSIAGSIKNVIALIKDVQFYKKFSKIIAIGPAVYQQMHAFPLKKAIRQDQVCLISNGVDTATFYPAREQGNALRQQFNIPLDVPVLLSASRLHRQKGVHVSLEAFAEFLKIQPGACYVILGEGSERSALESQAKHLGIENQVFFIGAIPRAELNPYLNMANVFLFTTLRQEGLPLNILEALAAGIPVVMSSHIDKGLQLGHGVFAVDLQSACRIAAEINRAYLSGNVLSLLPEAYSLRYCVQQYQALMQSPDRSA